MQIHVSPEPATWEDLLRRPAMDLQQLEAPVTQILDEVRQRGDEAILDFTARFDKVRLADLRVLPEEIAVAQTQVSPTLQSAIQTAAANIRTFHTAQKQVPEVIETMPGVRCWRRSVGIERVGLYIPGGTAPLFSTVLMLAIPAQIAGCKEIVLCTPPRKDGTVHPAILFAAQLAGVTQIFKAGGAQAIAGMAYGTNSIPATYKIFGPGNAYVTVAKQLVSRLGVAIDMPAGPSEVMVCADESAHPRFIAADLLSQAEHGADSQVVLVTTTEKLAQEVLGEVKQQMETLPRAAYAEKSIGNSVAIVAKDQKEMLDLINAYAPEHLILSTEQPYDLAADIINAGSVFLGHYTPESVGDYASGTNHTLPTNGFARAYSGVSLDTFVKKITYQELTQEGIQQIGPTVMEMAENEQLDAHRLAVAVRLEALSNQESPAEKRRMVEPRASIAALRPYSSARDEFTGQAEVYLDANENPFDNDQNRYPDPLARAVKEQLSQIKGIAPANIMLGNGSDEIIDLLFRIFCEPGRDQVITLPPTYGMYSVSADINNVEVVEVPLLPGFQPNVEGILAKATHRTKILWLCSPNNPSGNDLDKTEVLRLLDAFPGLVVIDEAYIDFAERDSYAQLLADYPNLVITQTFSKAWGRAGIRLGMAFASTRIIGLLNAVKPPYNVNQLTQRAALEALSQVAQKEEQVQEILRERERLAQAMAELPFVQQVHASAANFLLVKLAEPRQVYTYLMEKGIIVRDRSSQYLCEGCLRFTVGTPAENEKLLTALTQFTS